MVMTAQAAPLNPLAQELNRSLEESAPEVLGCLSALGRRLYFPRGILSQSAEANERASHVNATIGIATEAGGPMYLPSIQAHLSNVDPRDAYPYASVAGRPGLRERWREKLVAENPSLAGKRFGRPIVTSAITHGLSLVGDLFVDPGDCLVLPDKLWGNYRLTYEVRYGGRIETFPFFEGAGFATGAFARALEETAGRCEKLIVLLNFPNNPTGYMPTVAEGEAIAEALVERARRGTRIVAICDDAYFGLFYHLGGETLVESLFGALANRHPNLLAVKLDGATKELFVWGLRCGFLTFGPGRAETADAVAAALEAKVRGAIRSGISNSPQLSQTLVEEALSSATIEDERKQKCATLSARAAKVHEVVNAPRYRESWEPYPFNSGYFMCLAVKGVDAEKVRLHLLDRYGVGVIATSATDLRIAFSCVETDEVDDLFERLHRAIQELR
jgi:aspartate/methionine/tyrosine aminotransferase